MKALVYSLIFCLTLLMISCNSDAPAMKTTSGEKGTVTASNLDWMVGAWKRTNNEEGKQTFEYWEKTPDGTYDGFAYTLVGKDTAFQEIMELKPQEDIWQLTVSGVNEAPTVFVFTDHRPLRFVCENPDNEFPQRISYSRHADKLSAIITGGRMKITFLFEKK
ncbi:MAG: DUF6265 family protein [Saprospiraceae bacterium]